MIKILEQKQFDVYAVSVDTTEKYVMFKKPYSRFGLVFKMSDLLSRHYTIVDGCFLWGSNDVKGLGTFYNELDIAAAIQRGYLS